MKRNNPVTVRGWSFSPSTGIITLFPEVHEGGIAKDEPYKKSLDKGADGVFIMPPPFPFKYDPKSKEWYEHG